jgi:hypothetical protein
MEIYVHSVGREDPELVEVSATDRVGELVEGEPGGENLVWLENAEEPLDPSATLEAARVSHRGNVHRGRCRKVETTVRFNGSKSHAFSPATTVDRVLKWATGEHGFDLSPAEAAKHTLALPGADHPLDPRVHIGSLVAGGTCDVVLDLVPKVRFEG